MEELKSSQSSSTPFKKVLNFAFSDSLSANQGLSSLSLFCLRELMWEKCLTDLFEDRRGIIFDFGDYKGLSENEDFGIAVKP